MEGGGVIFSAPMPNTTPVKVCKEALIAFLERVLCWMDLPGIIMFIFWLLFSLLPRLKLLLFVLSWVIQNNINIRLNGIFENDSFKYQELKNI